MPFQWIARGGLRPRATASKSIANSSLEKLCISCNGNVIQGTTHLSLYYLHRKKLILDFTLILVSTGDCRVYKTRDESSFDSHVTRIVNYPTTSLLAAGSNSICRCISSGGPSFSYCQRRHCSFLSGKF